MPRSRQQVVFEDFSLGEYGSLAPWRAPQGSFTGKNINQYVDGSLGPRNGLKQLTLSGDAITGTVSGFGRLSEDNGAKMWAIAGSGTAFYTITIGGVVKAFTGALAVVPPEPPMSIQNSIYTYISVLGDKMYKIDPVASTVTAVATPNSPGCRAFVRYGNRFLAAGGSGGTAPAAKAPDGTTANANRIYFSEPDQPENWPALNFVPVGASTAWITGLFTQRTHLVITMSDGTWWIMTGVPGVNYTLRQQLDSVAPLWPTHAIETGAGQLGYVIGSSGDSGSTPSLGLFTGSQVSLNPSINFGNGRTTTPHPTFTVVPLKNPDDWFVMGGAGVAPNQVAKFQNNLWSLHEFQIPGPINLQGYCSWDTVPDQHFVTNGGAPGVTPKFYQWRAYNNRPGFVGDTLGQPGDATTTPFDAYFSLPEWYDHDGRDVRVIDVVVDFTSWDTGAPVTNHFDLVPKVLRTFETGSVTIATRTFDEAGAASVNTIGGTRRRKRFQIGDAPDGNGFQLSFQAIRGVAIQRVSVTTESDGPRI